MTSPTPERDDANRNDGDGCTRRCRDQMACTERTISGCCSGAVISGFGPAFRITVLITTAAASTASGQIHFALVVMMRDFPCPEGAQGFIACFLGWGLVDILSIKSAAAFCRIIDSTASPVPGRPFFHSVAQAGLRRDTAIIPCNHS